MPMPKKPDELKKVGVSVGLTRLLVQAIDDARGIGESRSEYVAKILRNHLSAQVKKLEKRLKN